MATEKNSSSSNNDKPPKNDKAAKQPVKPPVDEAFWQRYSPHHEFPISLFSATFLHVMIPGALIFGAMLLTYMGMRWGDAPVPVDGIVIAGGGGNPEGIGKGPGDGIVPSGQENVTKDVPETISVAQAKEQVIKDPTKNEVDLTKSIQKADSQRKIDPNESKSQGQLVDAGTKARQKLEGLLAGKGQGGSGSGGGLGKGKGTGEGDLSGPGKANITQREKRKNRWVMVFNTNDGDDYLRQLRGLGAILAIPDDQNGYLVIRDLTQRPVMPKPEDLTKINRIYWIDDQPRSVQDLSRALGLSPVPPLIVAFFPVELEKELLEKELAVFRGREDDIKETVFTVRRRGNTYEPVVSRQEGKR
jgi:hypothetical protein